MAYNYDYSQTMWLKFFNAQPDFPNNCSKVFIDYEQSLRLIQVIDTITQGIPKIVYLVGWQGYGHDDCYPEMNRMNEFMKRPCDATAHDSYMWLYHEAKEKYHTVVSVHSNMSDAYMGNPTFDELVKVKAIAQLPDGTPAKIEMFNGRDSYKICYRKYVDSGLFKKVWADFIKTLPIQDAGTVHLDNFALVENLYDTETSYEDQVRARNEMLTYITRDCGIDVTSEYTYRELPLGVEVRKHVICHYYGNYDPDCPPDDVKAPQHCLGLIASTLWYNHMTPEDCIRVQPNLHSGRLMDKGLFNVFYGHIHGEEIWREHGLDEDKWVPVFIRDFCLEELPYHYLNRYVRLTITDENGDKEDAGRYTATFSGGIVTRGRDRSIAKNGILLKQEDDVILPLTGKNDTFIAYSLKGREGLWNIPDARFTEANVYEITADGNRFIASVPVQNGQLALNVAPGQALTVIGR